jgi:polar amino acid transport system substrate-binding protein
VALRERRSNTTPTAPRSSALLAGETDAVAGVRQPLTSAARAQPGFQVMDGRFVTIEQAMALLKGRPNAHAFLCEFIEEMKASGSVAAALVSSGQGEATVVG